MMHWLKRVLLIFGGLLILQAHVFAQSFILKGIIFRQGSSDRISQAVITDLNDKEVMMSDDLGMFSIKTAMGDTLLITHKEYTDQKIVVSSRADLAVYLAAVIRLKPVIITGQTKKQELNDVMKQYNSQGIYNNGKSLPVFEFLNSPITGLYNLFGKTPREERRFAAYAQGEMESIEVDKRYTKELVKSVTKIPDNELLKFMDMYRPSYQDIREWNDYRLIMYIKKSYAYYQKIKNRPQPKVQSLN
ncbi:MAG: hypothetical protein JST19_11135 [Bacteroidetes bacterium]|nr:hypothetical protein [Bacteroidota bacterium]